MKMLCKLLAGSHLYGLNVADSDIDYRGVYVHTDLKNMLGMENLHESYVNVSDKDESYHELKKFLALLRKTNVHVIEVLNAPSYIELGPQFDKYVVKHHKRFYTTEQLYKTLKGYIQSEKGFANGKRLGQLGGKRKAAIDKYGFSPKNFVHLLRLACCGSEFFRTQNYPVQFANYNKELTAMLMDIKLHPEKWNVDQLNKMVVEAEDQLDKDFTNRNKANDLKFDEEYAEWVLFKIYWPTLLSLKDKYDLETEPRLRSS